MNYSFPDLILARLEKDAEFISREFNKSHPYVNRFVSIDNLLPEKLALDIYQSFPKSETMRLMQSFREVKFTSKNIKQMSPIMGEIIFAFQDQRVIDLVEKITGLKQQYPDPYLYAGGISLMEKEHFLNPHIDNSHDKDRKMYRTLNLLYYVTPDWTLENGGNLELWDKTVTKKETIVSQFNRLVLMETNAYSWHSVSPVTADKKRACVSNYYFSPLSPSGKDYFHITAFNARPEQPLRRVWCKVDTAIRTAVRLVKKQGIATSDLNK